MKRIVKKFVVFIIAILIPQIAGFIGSVFTITNDRSWYANIVKPSFNPPNWVFGPVWTILFIMMGIALYFVWVKNRTKDNSKYKNLAYWFFGIQLALNTLWSILFFGLHCPLCSLVEIFILLVAIIVTIIYFFKVNKVAGWLMIPYLFWVSFATILNFAIVILN